MPVLADNQSTFIFHFPGRTKRIAQYDLQRPFLPHLKRLTSSLEAILPP